MADESKDTSADKPKGRKWCIAVDGSHAAHNAFLTAMRFARREDSITVVHAADPKKDYLPEDLKTAYIRERYEVDLVSRYPEERYEVCTIDRRGKSAKDVVCAFVNEAARGFDFLVTGCVGRKGPKLSPTVLGSTADSSLRAAHLTSIIARKPPAKEGATFVVGVDGSDRAHEAYQLAVSFANPSDTVLLVHIEADTEDTLPERYHTAAIVKRYKAEAAAKTESKEAPTVTVKVLDPSSGKNVADILNGVAHEELAAALFIGVDGLRQFVRGKKTVWGSVSDRIVRTARTSIVCVQPKGAIYA